MLLRAQSDRVRSTPFNDAGERLIDWQGERIKDFDADDLCVELAAIAGIDIDTASTPAPKA